MGRPWRLAGIVLPMALAACSAQQCDPNRTDLFSGIGCSVGSGYGDRTNTLKSQYQTATTNANQESLQAIEARQEALNSESELSRREEELSALDGRTRSLRGRLAAARRSHRASKARLQEAQAALDAFSQARQQTGASSSQAAIDALKVRQQKLMDIATGI